MTDINTELEAIAAEELGDEQLTEVAADEPKKGAAAAMPPEKVEGERQDMGPAVVSPDAKSDPGKEASKKAKKSPDLPDKGKPSDASPAAMGDGSGPMKSGAREEVEYDEDAEVEAIAEEEDTQDEMVEGETIEDRVSAMDLSDDVNALTEGEDLSEEFKEKAATIFEAAIKAKLQAEIEHLDEIYQAQFDKELEEAESAIAEKVDSYLSYVVEEWMKKNEIALEHKLKTEIAESFIKGLKTLFEEHNVAIPDEQFDVLDAAADQVNELEAKLNETIESNMAFLQEVNSLKRNEILLDVASDLADTEVEKFAELAVTVDYENEEDFRQKVDTIKESYFPKEKSATNNDTAEVDTTEDVDVSDTMAAYLSAITRTQKSTVAAPKV
ncbi:MAG: T4 prohead core scaffold protein [Candidatus Pacebacteria bacterium]|nr:T4 prohead core scaffold protein [Candidatus Paceibacterota bacterium]